MNIDYLFSLVFHCSWMESILAWSLQQWARPICQSVQSERPEQRTIENLEPSWKPTSSLLCCSLFKRRSLHCEISYPVWLNLGRRDIISNLEARFEDLSLTREFVAKIKCCHGGTLSRRVIVGCQFAMLACTKTAPLKHACIHDRGEPQSWIIMVQSEVGSKL